MARKLGILTLIAGALALGTVACSSDENGGPTDGSIGRDGSNANDGGGTNGDGGGVVTDDAGNPILLDGGGALCKSGVCQCSDGIDNDMDGLIDGADPECTGAIDDREDSFATGIPGDNMDPKQDCFFDGNSGAGNDKCDPGCFEQPPSGNCSNADYCQEYCGARTPPGCDCFGCCAVYNPKDGMVYKISLASGGDCSLDNLAACDQCTQVDCGQPQETCGECELCLGKTIDDLPSTCFEQDASTPDLCNGRPTCGASNPCDIGSYCAGGCCVPYG